MTQIAKGVLGSGFGAGLVDSNTIRSPLGDQFGERPWKAEIGSPFSRRNGSPGGSTTQIWFSAWLYLPQLPANAIFVPHGLTLGRPAQGCGEVVRIWAESGVSFT